MISAWGKRLFAALVPDGYADQFFADLEEEYAHLAASRGVPFARRWYWGQLVRSLPSLMAHEIGGGGKLRNYLAAALRNLARNRLYAGINIAGLAVGFAAAILIALFVRDEFSYDKWIPGYENVYRLSFNQSFPGQAPRKNDETASIFAPLLKLDFPQIEATTRLDAPLMATRPSLRHGDVEAVEPGFYWADPNVFDVLPLPALAGDLKTALQQPDGIVLTRRMARKYFGRDNPLGETIELDRQHPMKVTAVLEDLPSNTHLNVEILASGRAEFSDLAKADDFVARNPQNPAASGIFVYLYLRLRPGASIELLRRALPDFTDRHLAPPPGITKPSQYLTYPLIPLAAIHLIPAGLQPMKPPGDFNTIYAVTAIGILIVLVAGINFINLMTARAARRAVEVGIRKVSGAARRDLVIQFIGESLIYAAFGMLVAMGTVELLLPALNGFLGSTIAFDYWRDPMLIGGIVGLTLTVGILAGTYPAFVLSAFKPAAVLKGGVIQAAGSGVVRQTLVVFQFAVLIGLLLATAIIYRQTDYAVNEGLRLDRDQVLVVTTSCNGAFKDEVRRLSGVRAAACSISMLGPGAGFSSGTALPDGTKLALRSLAVDFGLLEMYGLKPLSGRFFSLDRGSDMATGNAFTGGAPIVINEAASRALGFASSDLAIGQAIPLGDGAFPRGNLVLSEIIGVVPDFSMGSIRETIQPTIYYVNPRLFGVLNVKLSGKDIPETLRAIDGLWSRLGDKPQPIARTFLDQYVQNLYLDITRQGQLFAAFAGVALFIACLGLFGLSAFTAERRTKEIGIRKAVGARRWDIVKLLVWQFLKPVLLANLIAWPVGYYFMNRWLHGFAYHVDLSPWIFIASGASALVIALATVSVHAFIVAGARPVTALRYE